MSTPEPPLVQHAEKPLAQKDVEGFPAADDKQSSEEQGAGARLLEDGRYRKLEDDSKRLLQ